MIIHPPTRLQASWKLELSLLDPLFFPCYSDWGILDFQVLVFLE